MYFSVWLKRLLIISLLMAAFCIVVFGGKGELKQDSRIDKSNSDPTLWNPANISLTSKTSVDHKLQVSPLPLATPTVNPKTTEKVEDSKKNNQNKLENKLESKLENPVKNSSKKPVVNKPKPKIVRKVKSPQQKTVKVSPVTTTTYKTTKAFKKYKPAVAIAIAHPSNYGDRYTADVRGNPLNNQPIAVLHETSNSAMSAINTFKTPHGDDSKQVSYHALVAMDGTIVYLVPPDKRAFGAGNSVFEGPWGIETVQTNPKLPPSVNNFAYHVSLETPPDGRGKYHDKFHSGYTNRQYKSLAWLLAQSSIPDYRITTHRNVDRSGQRIDPRSFDFDKFFKFLRTYRQSIVATEKGEGLKGKG